MSTKSLPSRRWLLFSGGDSFGTSSIAGGNLAVWLRPEGITHDGTNVLEWRNDGTAGGKFTQTIDTAKRFRYSAAGGPGGVPAARGNAANNSYMVMDSTALGMFNAKTGGTSFAVWKTSGTQTQAAFYSDTGSGGSTNRFTHHRQSDSSGNGSITMRTTDNVVDGPLERTYASANAIFTDDVYGIDTIRHDVGANHFAVSFNGRIVGDGPVWQFGAPSTFPATDSTRISIGATGNTGQYDKMRGDSYLVELIVCNRPLTYAEEKRVWDYLHAKYPSITKNYGSETDIVLCDGDSIMQGLVRTKDAIPWLAVSAMASPSLIYWRNDGISGTLIQYAESDITGVKGILNGIYPGHLSLRNAIYDISIGTNNVSSGSESAATAFGRLTSLFGTLTTNNIAVNSAGVGRGRLVTKQIPRYDNATTANVFAFNTEMTNRYNELANVGVEGIVDPTSLAAFDGSPDGLTDVSDTTYYQGDKIHPNAAGCALIAPLHTAQLEQIRKKRQIESLYGQYIKAWYAAGEEITLNSSTVSSWGDRNSASTNYDMLQSTAAKQPAFSKNYRLGYPALDFDGAASTNNDLMETAAGGRGLLRNNNNALLIGTIVCDATPAINEYIFLSSVNGSNSTARVGWVHTTADKLAVSARNQDAGGADSTTSSASLGTGLNILATYTDFANTDAYIWINGALDTADTSFDNGASPKKLADTDAGFVGFGGAGNNGNIFNGKILEYMILADFPDKTTADACRDLIEDYMGKKFTITVT